MPYIVIKQLTISASHRLVLPYKSSCCEQHGHNWRIAVYCRGSQLIDGMLIDFSAISKEIKGRFDHKDLNACPEFSGINPTAENMARLICEIIPTCFKVDVWETDDNCASYEYSENDE